MGVKDTVRLQDLALRADWGKMPKGALAGGALPSEVRAVPGEPRTGRVGSAVGQGRGAPSELCWRCFPSTYLASALGSQFY